ncbi:hypothetical protein BGX38DRAFT_1152720 [Terfezia claveryi]|nr:hypothetical protein BGX38DRAFT_1152720 [Terfezia claveryi]
MLGPFRPPFDSEVTFICLYIRACTIFNLLVLVLPLLFFFRLHLGYVFQVLVAGFLLGIRDFDEPGAVYRCCPFFAGVFISFSVSLIFRVFCVLLSSLSY